MVDHWDIEVYLYCGRNPRCVTATEPFSAQAYWPKRTSCVLLCCFNVHVSGVFFLMNPILKSSLVLCQTWMERGFSIPWDRLLNVSTGYKRESWKIHSVNVLSSVSLFSALRTELHCGWVGQCPTLSTKSRIRCNLPFFSKWVTHFVQPADMEMENPVEKGKRLLQFWGGKSLHIIDLVYLPKSVQLTWK